MDLNFPIVKNMVGKMTFRQVPPDGLRASFRCNLSWEEIQNIITTYFNTNNIEYVSSKATAAFTVVSKSLKMDIIIYVHELGYYLIGFHRISGDILAGSNIYIRLMSLLTDFQQNIIENPEPDPDPNGVYDFDALLE